MSYVNPTQKKETTSHLNWMGGNSFDIKNPLKVLRLAAASCFFGEPMYYHKDATKAVSKKFYPSDPLSTIQLNYLRDTLDALDPKEWRTLSPAKLMENAIDAALDVSIEETLKIAVALRNEDNIRVTPQIILVRAANHKNSKGPKITTRRTPSEPSLITKYAPQIIRRADEPATGLAYHLYAYPNASIPNALKRAWKTALEGFNDYQLAKYQQTNHVVKTVDVARLVWPRGDSIQKLLKGQLKNTNTWESIISAQGSSKSAWTKALDIMGHMALLRNLRNLIEHDVPVSLFKDKLIDGARDGKQLPFRYYSAYKAIESIAPPSLVDALEEAMEASLKAIPRFRGNVISLCDNSGSAQGATTSNMGSMSVASIGNLTGVLTGMCSDEGYVGIFGDGLLTVPIYKRNSIFKQVSALDQAGTTIGEGTENGIWVFWNKAIKDREHWDHIFVYSDMQAGHGGLYGLDPTKYRDYIMPNLYSMHKYIDVAKLVKEYRKRVNPNVLVYLVQIAGYQDTLIPEFYNKTFILGGWGDGVLRFASKMANNFQNTP